MADEQLADSLQTDIHLCEAIESLTQSSLSDPDSAAIALWENGGREDELRAELDRICPGWRDDAPLFWGEEELTGINDDPFFGMTQEQAWEYAVAQVDDQCREVLKAAQDKADGRAMAFAFVDAEDLTYDADELDAITESFVKLDAHHLGEFDYVASANGTAQRFLPYVLMPSTVRPGVSGVYLAHDNTTVPGPWSDVPLTNDEVMDLSLHELLQHLNTLIPWATRLRRGADGLISIYGKRKNAQPREAHLGEIPCQYDGPADSVTVATIGSDWDSE